MFNNVKDLPRIPMTWQYSTVTKTGAWRTSRPIIDKDKCIKCYLCWKFCPDIAIDIGENHDEYPEVDYDHCKGCGICANECPVDAIIMVREASI